MGSALWAGISGLNASSKQMDVIANNLANVNTLGFKAGTTYFSDVLSQSISGGGGSLQVGRGVAVAEIQTQFGSGSFETTGNATDVAIDGDGFFMVNNADGGTFFTRAGAFIMDETGLLVDTNGYAVQGKVIDAAGGQGPISDLNLQRAQNKAAKTTEFALGANLNSQIEAGDQYNTTQTIYDSQGDAHTMNTTFTKTEMNDLGYWSIQSSLDSTAATSITSDGLYFDGDGILAGTYTGDMGTTITVAGMAITTLSAVTPSGAGTATVTLDRPQVANATPVGNMLLTRTSPTAWTITTNGGYTSAAFVSADATTVNINLDGDTAGTVDLHLTLAGTWANGDTATFTFTRAVGGTAPATSAVLDRPGMIYKDATGMTLSRSQIVAGVGGAWSFANAAAKAGYSNAQILSTSTQTQVDISLDGTGTTDLHLLIPATTTEAAGTVAFDLNNTTTAGAADVLINYSGIDLGIGKTIGDASGNVTWRMVGNDALDITQYAAASVIRALTADGYASGDLKSLAISEKGRISGYFTNGQTADLAQLILARFPNPWGLQKMGSNLFGETLESGSYMPNEPGEGGMGSLSPNAVEMSNTDIATEFIKMITAQKAYQACARVVTTEDTLMQELMNLKR